MIYILLSILLISIVVIEYIIFYKNKRHKRDILQIKEIDQKLGMIKDYSYSFSTKQKTFFDITKDSISWFLKELELNTVVIIDNHNENLNILRYTLGIDSTIVEGGTLTPLERYLLEKITLGDNSSSEKGIIRDRILQFQIPAENIQLNDIEKGYKSVIEVSLIDKGYVFFLSNGFKELTLDEKTFIRIVVNIINITLRRIDIDKKMSYQEQLKAVNVEW